MTTGITARKKGRSLSSSDFGMPSAINANSPCSDTPSNIMGSQQQQTEPQPSPNAVAQPPNGGAPPAEGTQQFCLRWNSYPATVATQLATLRAAEDFVDVTLACDGRQLRAHKLVLSACSPYFMQLFKSTPCKHPVIFLKDVGFRQLVALLEFMYAGEVNVSQAELPALLRTAEALQVRGLADTNPNNNNNEFSSPQQTKSTAGAYQEGISEHLGGGGGATDGGSGSVAGGGNAVCSSQQNTAPPCDSSSNVMNPCSNNSTSSGKRSVKNEEEESDEDSGEFEMGGMEENGNKEVYMEDGSLQQFEEDTGEVFPQNLGDTTNSFDLSQGQDDDHDLSGDLLGGEDEEENFEGDEDENSLDACGKAFPGFPNDSGGYEGGPSNGSSSQMTNSSAGPSGMGGGSVNGMDAAAVLGLKGADGLALNPPGPGEGRGRNRLARSLWPPGIPYHGPQQCPYCPRILSNVGNWRKHVLTMHFAREKVYKCHLCSSSFRTSEYLQKHYVRVHNYPQKMTRKKFAEQS